jgi:hypothetical protein
VPLVALSFCLGHGVVKLSERRARRCILSPAIMLGQEGKAEGIFDYSPVCLDGGMVFGDRGLGFGRSKCAPAFCGRNNTKCHRSQLRSVKGVLVLVIANHAPDDLAWIGASMTSGIGDNLRS